MCVEHRTTSAATTALSVAEAVGECSPHRAGVDVRDADVEWGQRVSHRVGDALQRKLAAGVVLHAGDAADARRR